MNALINIRLIFFLIVAVVLVHHPVNSKRSGSGGRQRTTPRTTNRQQTTPQTQQQNSYQVGNAPPPVYQSNNPPAIGFDNANKQASNTHPIGFENVQNRPPQGNQPPPNIGFNNGYHPPQQQFGGNNPQINSGGYNPQVAQSPGTWNHPNTGYNPPGSQFGGYTPHGSGGAYNPYLSQPGSYYNNYAAPGIQPQFYQPQQSSGFGGGSLLGYAGSFGGGYLLGRLTSGGHDNKDSKDSGKSDKNEQQFVVHHYYHNSQEIPKQITVTNNSLVTCMQNVTQHLCVPNTFPMCLSNGTIMCVTHTRFTVPCGSNTSMACIITAVPCNSKDKSCNSASNLSTNVVYVPCISNVTITGQNDTSLGNSDLCITAIAEPAKKLQSPIPSLINLMGLIAAFPFRLQELMSNSSSINITTIAPAAKTEMPPTKVKDF